MKTITLFALILATQLASAAWKITSSADELTDEVSYWIYNDGEMRNPDIINYTPSLVIKVTPINVDCTKGHVRIKHETAVMFKIDAVGRDGFEALIRFDSEPAAKYRLVSGLTRQTGFFMPKDDQTIFESLKTSHKMLFRFKTTLGFVRTFSFDVADFPSALNTLKQKILADSASVPKTVPND